MKSILTDMLVRTQKRGRRRDLQPGKYYFPGASESTKLARGKGPGRGNYHRFSFYKMSALGFAWVQFVGFGKTSKTGTGLLCLGNIHINPTEETKPKLF